MVLTSALPRTIVLPNTFAARAERFALARAGNAGCEVLTFGQLAARLAGGFLQVVTGGAVAEALEGALTGPMGELEGIAPLPGFRRAAAATFAKAWYAGLDLGAMARSAQPATSAARRYAALALLEERVLAALPPSMRRPGEIAARARSRLKHAPRLFGEIEIRAHTELEPVWRPLLGLLASVTNLRWIAGPTHVPAWLTDGAITLERTASESPRCRAESCANPSHEVLEAVRWARVLIVEHGIAPGDIAIAAASTGNWDEEFALQRAISDVPIYPAQGERVVRTSDGQIAAALAELLLNGVSPSRLLRFIELDQSISHEKLMTYRKIFDEAPPLNWAHVRAAVHDLRDLADLLEPGCGNAAAAASLLPEGARAQWHRALLNGPPEALTITLSELRVPVGDEESSSPEYALLWCSAETLAARPRPYARLLGLTSRAWPRGKGEDPLLPEHIVAQHLLDPLPSYLADRRDFASIVAKTSRELVFSRSRRDTDGRLNGISPLWPREICTEDLPALRAAPHAANSADRMMLRLDTFSPTPRAESARSAWADWQREELTAHDGLMPAEHPILRRALNRVQSATSLQKLLRAPLSFLWTYGFGWRAELEPEEPFELDARLFGTLVHELLEQSLHHGGIDHLKEALAATAHAWERDHSLPPSRIWRATLTQAERIARIALAPENGERYEFVWGEVAFGGTESRERVQASPWDSAETVTIPETMIRFAGRIDRLELSADGRRARVTDYKTAKTAPPAEIRLAGGAELQRCLYAYAVRSLLPRVEEIDSRLLYPNADPSDTPLIYPLPDPERTLEQLSAYLAEAETLFAAGATLPSIATILPLDHDETFALPANASEWYLEQKSAAIRERLAALAPLWEMP